MLSWKIMPRIISSKTPHALSQKHFLYKPTVLNLFSFLFFLTENRFFSPTICLNHSFPSLHCCWPPLRLSPRLSPISTPPPLLSFLKDMSSRDDSQQGKTRYSQTRQNNVHNRSTESMQFLLCLFIFCKIDYLHLFPSNKKTSLLDLQ